MATLIELCAGSAAVSLRWLGQRPPFGTCGGKSGFADRILAAMGLHPGAAGPDDEVVLCEPGMWGEAWALWIEPDNLDATARYLERWISQDPVELWRTLAAGPIPFHEIIRVATWAVLQYWSYAGKAVFPAGGSWRHHGMAPDKPYPREVRGSVVRGQTIGVLIERLQALDLSRVSKVYRSIAEVPLRPGARSYLDPPYVKTTQPYEHQLPREEVLRIAQERAAGGERVYVSEAEPLPLRGWRHLELGAPRGRGRNNFTKQRREVLTLSQAGP